ncbi:hypothetical protein D3C71_1758240 [compost metagenome]
MPTDFLIDLGAQAQRHCSGRERVANLGRRVEIGEVRPNDHDFALTEGFAVRRDLFLGLTIPGRSVDKASQLLRDAHQSSRDLRIVQARGA